MSALAPGKLIGTARQESVNRNVIGTRGVERVSARPLPLDEPELLSFIPETPPTESLPASVWLDVSVPLSLKV